jgi:bifunctional non-homologous end joining protein LigD
MPQFVIHKHKSKNLHYDLRLEIDGVLKSWAIPKGPSMDSSKKRLAIMVDDHHLSCADYEGVIPGGSYGAGPVMVWDRGQYTNLKPDGIDRGRIEISLNGKKLKGNFALIKMKGKGGKLDGKNWLLIKMKDEFANRKGDILDSAPDSVKSGRSLSEIEAEEPTPPPSVVK